VVVVPAVGGAVCLMCEVSGSRHSAATAGGRDTAGDLPPRAVYVIRPRERRTRGRIL